MVQAQSICWLLCVLLLAGCAGTLPVPTSPSDGQPTQQLTTIPTDPIPTAQVLVPSEAQIIAAIDDENSIFFPLRKTSVDAAGRHKLQQNALRLKENPKLVVTLVGSTDDLGSAAYNLAIAEQRVNSVYQLLRSYGVPRNQLRRYAVGREKTASACNSSGCREKMRRVELVYPQ